jgi:hypothetical protein
MAQQKLPRQWRINPQPKAPREVLARRRFVVGLLLATVLVAGRIAFAPTESESERVATIVPPPTLPNAPVFPQHRIVAYYGAPQSTKLGALGIGTPDEAAMKLRRQAQAYASPAKPVIPAMELIAAVASSNPQADGTYRTRQPPLTIQRYLDAARRAHAMLILDIQPGNSDFLSEAKVLEPYLKEPDVALALDPEWHLPEGQIPGQTIGSVTADEVNKVADYLAGLVQTYHLPQKPLLVHTFTEGMIQPKFGLRVPPGVQEVINVDGTGRIGVKRLRYVQLVQKQSTNLFRGFKVFFHEDQPRLMTPREILRLIPPPDVVIYE